MKFYMLLFQMHKELLWGRGSGNYAHVTFTPYFEIFLSNVLETENLAY